MILDKIAASSKLRVEAQKRILSERDIRTAAETMKNNRSFDFPFEKALTKEDIAFICEVKKASPSKGVIAADFDPVLTAKEYEAAGADAVSVLTEPEFFQGSDLYLQEISAAVNIPALRKDFIVDGYQIYQAKLLGAAAILLICELTEEEQLKEYLSIARCIGLSALVESHSLPQMEKALRSGAKIIGVNNRNLDTFEVDITTSIRLRSFAGPDCLFVAESGISSFEDIRKLRGHHVNAVLIGETLMRSADKIKELAKLRGM